MVFLVLSRHGADSFFRDVPAGTALWLGANVLSAEDLAALNKSDTDISVFNHEISPSDHDAIDAAVLTIKEHHPGLTVWVER